MYGYIYETTNLINGKKYIGQHKASKFDENYYGSGKLIRQALLKEGKENFKVRILEKCNDEDTLNNREIFWIDQYRKDSVLYNITDGGHYRFYNTGHKLSEEHKAKIGNSNRGKHIPKEVREKISKTQKGKKLSEETRRKMSEFQRNRPKDNRGIAISKALKGHNVSKATREKISKAQKQRFKDPKIRTIYSNSLKRAMTSEVRKKISDSCKGRVAVNNGIHNKYVKKDYLDIYLANGYTLGRIKRGDKCAKLK